MSNHFQKLMEQIHAPAELEQRVIQAARQAPSGASRTKGHSLWYGALCAACVLALVVGIALHGTGPSETGPGSSTFPPVHGLILTASAADLPAQNPNGGLGILLSKPAAGQEGYLFQISGEGIQTLTLAIEGGELFHRGHSEALSTISEPYTPHTHYGFRLTGDFATLTVTANERDTLTYQLTPEVLRLSQTEDGQSMLVPRLIGDPSEGTLGVYATNDSQSRWFLWPVDRCHTIRLSAPYGPSPTGYFHTGIDIPAQSGSPISAAADGQVVESGFQPDIGHYVVLEHSGGLVTRYHHCLQIDVENGASVQAGDIIAQVGSSGMSTGPHLHFEVRQDGVAQDPTTYFDRSIRDLLHVA